MVVTSKLEELMAIAGEHNVCDDPACLKAYGHDESFALPLKPWFLVRPQTALQVQQIVKWANQTATPLVPVSSGAPHFNGDTVPGVTEAAIVDMSGMKAIKRIDRRNKIVVIEPGVTYGELEPALAEAGLRIARPLLPRINKSVVASLLERQPTTIPRLNYSLPEPLRVCGVVWGTGEYAFTGEGGNGPLSLEAQWQAGLAQVNQQGPMATDLMRLLTGAQGTMGIVVWASIKCELLPTARKYLAVTAPRLEDLIDFCYRVERLRLGDDIVLLNGSQLQAVTGRRTGAAPWTILLGLTGSALYPQEKVDVQEKELRPVASEFGLELQDEVPGAAKAEIAAILSSLSIAPHWKLAYKGACQDIFFLTTLDKTPEFLRTVESVAARYGYPLSDIGVYIQPQHHGVSQHVEFSFPYDPGNRGEVAAVKSLYQAASEALIAQGAYFSRPYGIWSDMVYSRDATASRVLKTVKQIVDPNRVLNPGKLCY
jgi:FAD/FMN-containing dehydrogenase